MEYTLNYGDRRLLGAAPGSLGSGRQERWPASDTQSWVRSWVGAKTGEGRVISERGKHVQSTEMRTVTIFGASGEAGSVQK